MSFASQGLSSDLVKALFDLSYEKLTPIQQKSLPIARKGHDIFAIAQTGTGKTAAFAVPLIQRLLESNKTLSAKNVRGLILAPTRELTEQIANDIANYTKYTNLSIGAVFGGRKMESQINMLTKGVDILVATPGRLEEHLTQKNVSITNLEFLVFDEADRILDLGFINCVHKIMMNVKTSPQIMMFSATSSKALNILASDILYKPHRIEISSANTITNTISHVIYPVDQERKTELLSELIGRKNWQQVLVFVNYKDTANNIVHELKLSGIKARLCHGDRAQSSRRRALEEFKSNKIRVLVATDVAARGLDIKNLPHVINYDMPFLAEDYVHRIGRTGRAGNKGHAISFVNKEEELTVLQIERLIKQKINRIELAGYETKSRNAYIAKISSEDKIKHSRRNNPN